MEGIGTKSVLGEVSSDVEAQFKSQNLILSFDEFIELFMKSPTGLMRNSAEYLKDALSSFGIESSRSSQGENRRRFKAFEMSRGRTKPPIIGQEVAHEKIFGVLEQFVRQGRVDKLILLHGPNGSSKSSTAEVFAHALEEYSKTDAGAVYRFNWIFPNDKVGFEGLSDSVKAHRIGFGDEVGSRRSFETFAHLNDDEIICKITSELKENPLFLVPVEQRTQLCKKALGAQPAGEKLEIPYHLEEGALSAKSKNIFDALSVAYKGDLKKIFRHVQVERFFFSSRYRTGIACVEPQMNIDAQDKQLTIERHLQNLPPVLQNIRLFELSGELIDANRGFIEFSDLLKRPLEAFKYLITTVEKMSLNLTSSIIDLDLIMMASTNEKYLDAFKASPDWASFKGRFELVRVPYLLSSKLEQRIYENDLRVLEMSRAIGPHAVDLLCRWAVLTRLRRPNLDAFEPSVRRAVDRLDPVAKLALYDGEDLGESFSEVESSILSKNLSSLKSEAQHDANYEGRFGASPRELKMMLYFAAQNSEYDCLSALAIFTEIEKIITDISVYEFLQYEVVGGYHDFRMFLRHIKDRYARTFEREFLAAMDLFNEDQYLVALKRYLKHVVAFVKGEQIENEITRRMEAPDEQSMNEIENLIGLTGVKKEIREKVMAKIASWQVDNPGKDLEVAKLFSPELKTIAHKIYESKKDYIVKIRDAIIMSASDDFKNLPESVQSDVDSVLTNLCNRYGYTRMNARQSLIFVGNYAQSLEN